MISIDRNSLMLFELLTSYAVVLAALFVRSPVVKFGLMMISLLHFGAFWLSAANKDPDVLLAPGPTVAVRIVEAVTGNGDWGIAAIVVWVLTFSVNAYLLRREVAERAVR